MKKYLLSLMMMAIGSAFVTSCLSDDDNNSGNNTVTVPKTTGLFVINNGSYNQNNGSLTYFDYTSLRSQQALVGVGGLGDTPNDAYTKGDTIFIVGHADNAIFVVNSKTLGIMAKVSTTDEMGVAEGNGPRHITGYQNKLYFTTYGGYVGELDANTLKVTNKYQVGSAPEGLCMGGSASAPVIYVANSDFGYGNASFSVITLSTGAVEEIKHEKIQNPQDIIYSDGAIYYLDWGHYTADYSQQLDAGFFRYYNGDVTQIIADATGLGIGLVYVNGSAVGYRFVTFNAPYGSTSKPTYTAFNTYTNYKEALNLTGDTGYEIFSPAAIAVDPLTGNIAIASRAKDPDSPAEFPYASYTLPGYVNMYSGTGQYIENTHFETGVEPHMIGFTLGKETITY